MEESKETEEIVIKEEIAIKEEPVDEDYTFSTTNVSTTSSESIQIKTEQSDENTPQIADSNDLFIKTEPGCELDSQECVVKEECSNSEENPSDILRRLLLKEKTTDEMESTNTSEGDKDMDENASEEPSIPQKFRVNMSAIESVTRENQASELHGLQGLSVYDQATLEAGILQQVDEALDQELEPGECPGATVLELEEGQDETEMERRIRLGEMTPFGSTMNQAAINQVKPIDGLSEIEKYLQKQQELQGKRTQSLSKKNLAKNKNAHHTSEPIKKKAKFKEGHKNKKRKVDESESEKDDFAATSEPKQSNDVRDPTHRFADDASGSEYIPSDSDCKPSSGDESPEKGEAAERKTSVKSKKRKASLLSKPYKIPEDWASDDSDWEYSDEEGNLAKKKRSKKELDDGDVDAYNRRLKLWQRERKNSGHNKEDQVYHKLGDGYKLPQDMWDKLFNYQKVGVRWLWELDQQRCGGILGDEMGLGKTIQVIAFLAGLHVSQMKDRDTNYRGLGPTLIVCPTTVMHQWVREFHCWYPPLRVAILHESGTFTGKQRSKLIGNMVHCEGILITSYTGAIQHKEEILTRRWHYIVLDEGHKIRNPDAQITLMVKQVRTTHRIILSGSPMQNNLKELWSLFDFVFPGKLGTLPVFMEQFAVPITQGGYANASQVQVMSAFKCATILKDSIAPYLLRRMKSDVKSHVNLPEKNEQVLFCRLTDEQRDLYKGYVESGEVSRILEGRLKIFMGLINLRKICNHPDLYSGGTKLLPGDREENLAEQERYGHWCKSGKMIVVETLLKLWKKQNHRVLIFTQSRQMLSIMEMFVRQAGYSFLKLDGGTSIAARQPLINKFNQDTSYFVMLLTTRVGGLGVNLTGANRVVIYDPDWNPATDTQARERAWRIGQKQTVTVYRLITAGTIEEKMYHRQIFKQFLCNKVLKDPRQRRFFKSNDLYELFTLKETDMEGSTETAAIFAGTGSEVKLDPTKKYKHRRVEPRLEAKPPAETFSRKKAEKIKRLEEKQKDNLAVKNENDVAFSDEKIERMKKLAQMLSKKISTKSSPEKSDSDRGVVESCPENNNSLNTEMDLNQPSTSEVKETPGCSYTYPSSNLNDVIENNSPTSSREEKHRKHKERHKGREKEKKKKRRQKDGKFEGERVPHLVKTRVASAKKPEEAEEQDKTYATQDEYVLQKLFAKSGLQTALKHDTIMEGGPADYALVEGEADRVAKHAVEKLKESRRECWRPASGVPTFTGLNGARNFQPKKRPGVVEGLSSSQLLDRIKKRNTVMDSKDSDLELVDEVRHFVYSQGGTVTTDQLIARFDRGLKEGSSPLFKSLLSKICTFYRAPDKKGYWTLKEEFNW